MRGEVAAIIVAAGSGKRLKRQVRKPYVPIGGRPILHWTLKAFEDCAAIDEVIVVIHPADRLRAERLIGRGRFKKVRRLVEGGATRQSSVQRGLEELSPQVKWVAVHDAARPLIDPKEIRSVLKEARISGAAILAVPVIPTVKMVQRGWIQRTLDRSRLWAAQTPQVFRRDWLQRAHARAHKNGATDDASLIEKLGKRVRIVEGRPQNIKITTGEDLVLARALLRANGNPSTRRSP